jgi:glycosyltransferase involved in cell wall biosynthesis
MKILVYFPVEKKYLKLWEYYKVDYEVINKIAKKVYYADNFISFLYLVLKCDYLYLWWWHRSLPAILISKFLKKKVICTGAIHMFDLSGETTFYNKSYLYKIFNKISLFICDYNIFISNDQKKQITSHIKTNNPVTIYSSLDKNHLTLYSELKKSLFEQKFKNLTFTTTTWLTKSNIKRKGLLETLESLESLNEIEFKFYICGKKGDGYEYLLDIIDKLKIKNKIKLITDISENDKLKLLKSTNIYIQPSYCEGLGNAVIEAMSVGCVPLVSRYTAQPEIVDDYGLIVSQINKEEIARKIFDYLNLKEEEKISYHISVLDYCHDKFSFETHCNELSNLISK